MEPARIERLALIATDAKASPWNIAINETQRMAIEADSTFGEERPDAGMKGPRNGPGAGAAELPRP